MITGSFGKTFSFGAVPTSAPPAPASYDPYYMGVSLLLHGDGSNGAAYFIDSSFEPQNPTVFGNTQTSTAQYKFGTASMSFDGSGDYIQYANNNVYNFGSGEFTIEMWIRPATVTGYHALIGYANGSAQNSNYAFQILQNGTGIQADIIQSNSQYSATASSVLTIDTWTHVAAVRSGNNWLLFINGALQATVNVTGVTNNNPANSLLQIGQVQGFYPFNGYIDELRITKGIARYTSTFSVATSAFPNIGEPDTYFPNVVYLNHSTGANASTAFVDSSSFSNTITATSPAAISTAQTKFGMSSAYFDGTSGLLSSPTSTNFDLGNTYTAECWIYPLDTTYNAGIFNRGYYTVGSGWTGFTFSMRRIGSAIRFYFYVSGLSEQYVDSSAGSVVTNAWQHVAMVRSGTTGYAFINGVLVGTITSLGTNAASSQPLTIGNFDYSANSSSFGNPSNNHFYGYIDEIRITKGVARYTSGFTPPVIAFSNYQNSAADSYYSNVSLLLHADGTNASTSFIDNSQYVNTTTAFGTAQVSTSIKKYGTGSASFNGGAATYLSTPTSSNFSFGTGYFTVEAWVYPTLLTSYRIILARQEPSTGMAFEIRTNTTTLETVLRGAGGVGLVTLSGGTLSLNTWHHVAVTRLGSTVTLYLNGVQTATATSTVDLTCSRPLTVGILDDTVLSFPFVGYIDDVRVSKGVSRYTANFTTPTSAFSNYGPIDLYYSSVSLLLHGDGTNASTTFTDNSSVPKTPTVIGNAQLSTAQKEFGTASISFDGSGDLLSYADNAAFNLTSGDWTIEMWINITGTSAFLLDKDGVYSVSYPQYTIQISAGKLYAFLGNGNGISPSGTSYTGTTTVTQNVWHHIAVVKTGVTCKGFLDGVQEWSSAAATMYSGAKSLLIGGDNTGSGAYTNGYIDDLRITKGVARYTTNFSIPEVAFPNS